MQICFICIIAYMWAFFIKILEFNNILVVITTGLPLFVVLLKMNNDFRNVISFLHTILPC